MITIDEKKKQVTIVMALTEQKSKSGKTVLIATTSGALKTETTYKGKPVTINVNCYVYPDAASAE